MEECTYTLDDTSPNPPLVTKEAYCLLKVISFLATLIVNFLIAMMIVFINFPDYHILLYLTAQIIMQSCFLSAFKKMTVNA